MASNIEIKQIQDSIQDAKLALAKRVAPILLKRAERVANRKFILFPWLRVWIIMWKLVKLEAALNG